MRNGSTKIVSLKHFLNWLITAFKVHLRITAVVGSDFVKTICQLKGRSGFAAVPLLNLSSNTKTSVVFFGEPFKAKSCRDLCLRVCLCVCRCWVGK